MVDGAPALVELILDIHSTEEWIARDRIGDGDGHLASSATILVRDCSFNLVSAELVSGNLILCVTHLLEGDAFGSLTVDIGDGGNGSVVNLKRMGLSYIQLCRACEFY